MDYQYRLTKCYLGFSQRFFVLNKYLTKAKVKVALLIIRSQNLNIIEFIRVFFYKGRFNNEKVDELAKEAIKVATLTDSMSCLI